MAVTSSSPSASDARGLDVLRGAAGVLKSLVAVDWASEPAGDATAAVRVVEQALRALSSIQAGALAAVEGDGSWADSGQRTIQSWMASETGSSRNSALKALGLAKSLHEDLPQTRKALASGVIPQQTLLPERIEPLAEHSMPINEGVQIIANASALLTSVPLRAYFPKTDHQSMVKVTYHTVRSDIVSFTSRASLARNRCPNSGSSTWA